MWCDDIETWLLKVSVHATSIDLMQSLTTLYTPWTVYRNSALVTTITQTASKDLSSPSPRLCGIWFFFFLPFVTFSAVHRRPVFSDRTAAILTRAFAALTAYDYFLFFSFDISSLFINNKKKCRERNYMHIFICGRIIDRGAVWY